MGFFDRFSSKKPDPVPKAPEAPAPHAGSEPAAASPGPVLTIRARLLAARDRLDTKDLPGAMALYETVLAEAGDRADVLVAISGDLGSHGFVGEIVELVAPRYDAVRHGPATGLNLLQAYLAVRNVDAAQHVLDILFALKRPELEQRLFGFSNAIAEILSQNRGPDPEPPDPSATKVGLVTLSKPMWFYGFESMAERLLPPKEGRLRKIAFAQLALPGVADRSGPDTTPEVTEELERLSRAIPVWLTETFYFTALYDPVAVIGQIKPPEGPARLMSFPQEWATENLRQLVDSTEGGLDYVFTGSLQMRSADYKLVLRVWDAKSFRERRTFEARWTPGGAETALAHVHSQIRGYMEWSPASAALPYTVPVQPRPWLDVLHLGMTLFLADKNVIGRDAPPGLERDLATAARVAPTGEAASLAYLGLRSRAAALGFAVPPLGALARSALVAEAQALVS